MTAEKLLAQAQSVQSRAQAKYSQYPVGAALLGENGQIILGCNIESKAYPTTMCAERVAMFSALSQGITAFKMIAVVTEDGATPCGSCRQVLYEYAGDIPVIIGNSKGIINEINLGELLPHPFA